MTDRLFADCCYGSDAQHLPSEPCPQGAMPHRNLDITNADHIALWIEHNTIPDEPMNQCASWLACRIVEAHEAALNRRTESADDALLQRAVDLFEMDPECGDPSTDAWHWLHEARAHLSRPRPARDEALEEAAQIVLAMIEREQARGDSSCIEWIDAYRVADAMLAERERQQ